MNELTSATQTAGLLSERLQAWKHAVGYLEQYVEAMEKLHKVQAKEYEKVLKVCSRGYLQPPCSSYHTIGNWDVLCSSLPVPIRHRPPCMQRFSHTNRDYFPQTISSPLREGHHFDQSLGGVAGFFENLRHNTQAMSASNFETERALKTSVGTVLERLHKEIKTKAKEFASGTAKGAKEVDKARNATQKHIELLGQHTASFESVGGKITAQDDPYVIKRGVFHRLHKQVLEENAHRNDLIGVQSSFKDFEAHVLRTIQQAVESLSQLAGGQGDKVRALHADVLGAAQRVPHDLEWNSFMTREGARLVDPNEPPRSVDAITFPNMDHAGAQPLVEGTLERKSRNKLSWGYAAGHYVVTPAGFLHEFKDTDDSRHEPKPELSVHLPGALVGAPSGDKFSVKGKDSSKTFSSKLSGGSELSFKAGSAAEAERWYKIIKECADTVTPASPTSPANAQSPISPTGSSANISRATTGDNKIAEEESKHADQETGVTGEETKVETKAEKA